MNSNNVQNQFENEKFDVVRKQRGIPFFALYVFCCFAIFFFVSFCDILFNSSLATIRRHLYITTLFFLIPVIIYLFINVCIRVYRVLYDFFSNFRYNLQQLIIALYKNKYVRILVLCFIVYKYAFMPIVMYIKNPHPISQTINPLTTNQKQMDSITIERIHMNPYDKYTINKNMNKNRVNSFSQEGNFGGFETSNSNISTLQIYIIAIIIIILILCISYLIYTSNSAPSNPTPIYTPPKQTSKVNKEIPVNTEKPCDPQELLKKIEKVNYDLPNEILYPGVVANTPLSKNPFAQKVTTFYNEREYAICDIEKRTLTNPRYLWAFYMQQKQDREQGLSEAEKVKPSIVNDMKCWKRRYIYMPATPMRCVTSSIVESGYCDVEKAYLLLQDFGLNIKYMPVLENLKYNLSSYVMCPENAELFPSNSSNTAILRLLELCKSAYIPFMELEHKTYGYDQSMNSVYVTDSEIMLRLFFMYVASLLHCNANTLYDVYVLPKNHVIDPLSTQLYTLHFRLDNVDPPHYNLYYENSRWNMLPGRHNIFLAMMMFINILRAYDKKGIMGQPIPQELLDIFTVKSPFHK